MIPNLLYSTLLYSTLLYHHYYAAQGMADHASFPPECDGRGLGALATPNHDPDPNLA